jgi:hypothetical protein
VLEDLVVRSKLSAASEDGVVDLARREGPIFRSATVLRGVLVRSDKGSVGSRTDVDGPDPCSSSTIIKSSSMLDRWSSRQP